MKGGGASGVGSNPIGTIRDSSSWRADVLLVDGLCCSGTQVLIRPKFSSTLNRRHVWWRAIICLREKNSKRPGWGLTETHGWRSGREDRPGDHALIFNTVSTKNPTWHLHLLLLLFCEHNQAKPEWEAKSLISLVSKNKTGVSLAAADHSRQIESCREINKLLPLPGGRGEKMRAPNLQPLVGFNQVSKRVL